MCFTMSGCYSADKSWAAKDGDQTIAIGIYLYYLYVAFDDAADKIGTDTEVLKGTIDGQSSGDWIRETAMKYLKSYIWVNNKIDELNLQLTDEETKSAESEANYMITNYASGFKSLGVSEDSFTKAYSEYNLKYKKVFDYYYGEGGEFAIPKDDLKETYVANNYSYGYMHAALTKTGDDSSSTVDLTDEEKAALTKTFDGYKQKVVTGYETLEDAAGEYALEAGLDESPYNAEVSDLKYQYYPTSFLDNLKEMSAGECRVFESDGQLVLLQKFDINDAFETAYATASDRLTMMLNYKSEEFTNYIFDQVAEGKDNITINDKAINSIKLSSLATDSTKMGTLSESSTQSSESSASETE